jgi:glucose-6-phosphate isomerase
MFDPGFNIKATTDPMGFEYGADCFGPEVEHRSLDAIRKSLKDPTCDGPDVVYSIAMDVGKKEHLPILKDMYLLYGCVTYAAGRLGDEPIRSQGHTHAVSAHCGWSTPEVYEIWQGKAVIYMQETAMDNSGKCYAVYAEPGDVVIVPPYWAHSTISADPEQPLTFGAWCDRQYGFEYDDIRAHGGLTWFPVLNEDNELEWSHNDAYEACELIKKSPDDYSFLGLEKGVSLYEQFEKNNELFRFVPEPELKKTEWKTFVP